MTARWQQSEASLASRFREIQGSKLKVNARVSCRKNHVVARLLYTRPIDPSIHPSIHPSSKDELVLFVIRAKVIQKKERERKKKSKRHNVPRNTILLSFLSALRFSLFATSPWKTLWYLVKNSVKSWS